MVVKYIEVTETKGEIRGVIPATLTIITKWGEEPRREKRYEIKRYFIKRKEGKGESSLIVGLYIRRHDILYVNGEPLFLDEEPYLDADIKIRRIERYNEKTKTRKIEYEIHPVFFSYTSGSDKLVKEIPSNIKNPKSIYRALDGIIAHVKGNDKGPIMSLDDIIIKHIIGVINKSNLCSYGSACREMINAYIEALL